MKRLSSLSIAWTLLLVACVRSPEYYAKQLKQTDVTYRFDAASDMPALFRFKATYLDARGKSVSEEVDRLPWIRTIAVAMPFEAHLKVDFSRFPYPPQQDFYDVGFDASITSLPADTRRAPVANPKSPLPRGFSFKVRLSDGARAEHVRIRIPTLKFDKRIAFTFTVDDSYENAWSRVWSAINRLWIDDEEFFHLGASPTTGFIPDHTLSMSDGCGHERRFGVGVAIWPNYGDKDKQEGRIKDTDSGVTNPYVTWAELARMCDFGCSVYFHNMDERIYDKNDPSEVLRGISDDRSTTRTKLGRTMKVMAVPDGLESYIDAALADDAIVLVRTTKTEEGIYHNYPDLSVDEPLYKKRIYSGYTDDMQAKLDELAEQYTQPNPRWVCHTVHRAGERVTQMLETVYRTYGLAGSDDIWVASYDEIYEYHTLRIGAEIESRTEEDGIVYTVTLPDCPDFCYPELSFVLEGTGGDCPVEPLTENITGLSHGAHEGGMLLNVDLDPYLPERAETYVSELERTGSDLALEDAVYFVGRLVPSLAKPYLVRIEAAQAVPLRLSGLAIGDNTGTVYAPEVEVTLQTNRPVVACRIGEKSDLSDAKWISCSDGRVRIRIADEYGMHTLYAQVRDQYTVSEVVSAEIEYADLPAEGRIPAAMLPAYLEKYDGFTLVRTQRVE